MDKKLVLEILAIVTGTAAVIFSACLENDISEEVLKICD